MALSRKISEDGDEYWTDSSFHKTSTRRNIFDDDVSFEKAKILLTASKPPFEDDDDDENENDEDYLVVRYQNTKKTHTAPDLSDLAVPFTSPAARANMPAPTAQMFGDASSMSHNRSQSLGGANQFPTRNIRMTHGTSDPSIEEVVNEGSLSAGKRNPTSSELDKLQKEIIYLKRELQVAKRDKWRRQPPADTIRHMVLGDPYTFELYRSKEDKLELLDKAIESNDGNAIIAAVLFLRRTIKVSLFNLELTRRPAAVNHYLCYLRRHFDYNELVDMLGMLGRSEEAAMFKYKIACSSNDPTVKIGCLKTCHRAHFASDPSLGRQASLVLEHIDLLERQRPVEESDAKAEASGQSQIFRDFPRRASLFGQPVCTTLYYFCLYHNDLGENSLASHQALRTRHQLSDKQYLWGALGARSKLRRWREIEALLTAKGWFGGTKLKAVIGFDKVVEILHKNKAPHDILAKYVALIDDTDQRLIIARKVECPKAIIDALVAQRDKAQLEAYAAKLTPRSQEAMYASDALRSSTTKWR